MENSNDYNKDTSVHLLSTTTVNIFSLETSSKPSINPSLELLSESSLELSPESSSEPSSESSSESSCETPFELPFEEHFESLSEQIYQYNLTVGDYFDDWQSVDTFMHQYCLERGFGYQVYRNDKDPNDFTIIRHKSFHCSSNGKYESRKVIDQKLHRLRGTIKTNYNYGRFRNVANALIEDELSSTYTWILQCLVKATDNIIPKSFWTDSELGLINAVAQVFPNTPHFYCMFHIWQNIIKHLKSKLGENFSNFSKAFYACRNALCIEIFEQRWEFMIKSFPNCKRYMTRTLYNNRIS
ncbi:unnamed protein product [Rhizophagus irregularis]|nr:unnamed protein product [Rhizophagus irregularis]